MAYTNTTLLGLNQPTTGQESGVWGDDVNNGFTQLVDLAVAGTNNITQDSDITLTVSNGNNASSFTSTATNSTVAQYAILNCTGARTAARNIIAPATSKTYYITNGTTGGYAITIKKTAGTGVSIAAGETAVVFYNTVSGDYVKATSISTAGVVLPANGGTGVANGTNNTITFTGNYTLGLTLTGNTAVTFPTSGTLQTTTGSLASNTGLPLTTGVTGTLPVANGGTNLTSFTANGVVYASSTSALATGSALTWNGNVFTVSTSTPFYDLYATGQATNEKWWRWGSGSSNYAITSINDAGTASDTPYSITRSGYLSTAQIWGIGASEKMRLTSTGLGIGTSSPAYSLDVNAGSASIGGAIRSTGTQSLLRFVTSGGNSGYVGADTNNMYLASTNGSTGLKFAVSLTAPDNAATIDSSGNLGLGVTPSAWNSTIKAAQFALGGSIAGATNTSNIALNSNAYLNSAGSAYVYINSDYATRYLQQGGVHYWYNASSGTATNSVSFVQAMTLDNSGNLYVGSSSSYAGKIQAWGAVTANAGSSSFSAIDTTSMASGVGGELGFFGQYTSGGYAYMGSMRGIKENGTDGNTACALTFYTRPNATVPSERMRIDSSGNLLVGTTSALANGISCATGANTVQLALRYTGNASGKYFTLGSWSNNGSSFVIQSSAGYGVTLNSETATSWSSYSDIRLKNVTGKVENALAGVMQLEPIKFSWKRDSLNIPQVGISAQSVLQVLPEAVDESSNFADTNSTEKYLMVRYTELIPLLTAAIQELNTLVTTQNAEIASLKQKVGI